MRRAPRFPSFRGGLIRAAAVNGILASNYATTQPAEILLIHPDSSDNILHQAQKAAAAGAMAAIGPIDRAKIEVLAKEDFLPLPVVALKMPKMSKKLKCR